ncbi:DUF1104 domain-containing protein [Campylobacter sp.]|uniref:DUF1104 domain-containing protein n=1 Tax=Campylobacter sp. TaxID=205 RepID=UPI0026F72BA4|nr:DUF1104 domain-containing protein [Campylobacter sp.]
MKKLGLIAALVATSLFAGSLEQSSNADLYAKIAKADAKTLSDISFEIHKRAGKLNLDAMDIRGEFRDEMQKKMSAMSADERVKFMQEYRGLMSDKLDSMSVKDAHTMGFFTGYGKYANKGYNNCMRGYAKGAGNFQGQGRGMGYNQGFGLGPCMK